MLQKSKPAGHAKTLRKCGIKINAFTLLELMFTVAIVGVLTAIAVPVYNAHRDEIRNQNAINDIYLMKLALERLHTETFTYPATLAALPSLPNNGIDPWGNAYIYLNIINGGPGIRGQVRKDQSTNPINSLYDLYSMGKDGATRIQLDNKLSVDDIVLGRDGGYIGLASGF